eukprot:Partr_v1_DN28812_c1_g1_i2_m33641 putative PAS domain containing serine threonine kinase
MTSFDKSSHQTEKLSVITEEEEEHFIAREEAKLSGLVRMRDDVTDLQQHLHSYSFRSSPSASSNHRLVSKAKFVKSSLAANSISADDLHQSQMQPSTLASPLRKNDLSPLKIVSTSGSSGLLTNHHSIPSPLFTPKIRFSPSDNSMYATVTTSMTGEILVVNEMMRALVDVSASIFDSGILSLFPAEYREDERKSVLQRAAAFEGEAVLQCGKLVRIMKGDRSIPVAAWVKKKKKGPAGSEFILFWVFELVDESECDIVFDALSGSIVSYDGPCFGRLFEVEGDVSGVHLRDLFPHAPSTDFQTYFSKHKYHSANSMKGGYSFPVITKIIQSKKSGQFAVHISSLANIAGMVEVTAGEEVITSSCTAIYKYLLGYSADDFLGKPAVNFIPKLHQVIEAMSAIASNSPVQTNGNNTLLSARVVRKIVNGQSLSASSTTASSPLSPSSPAVANTSEFFSGQGTLSDSMQIKHRDGSMLDIDVQIKQRQGVSDSSAPVFRLWLSFTRSTGVGDLENHDPLRSPPVTEEYVNKLSLGSSASILKSSKSDREPSFAEINKILFTVEEEEEKQDEKIVTRVKSPPVKESIKFKDRKMADYEIVQKIGEGAFGVVQLAKLKPQLSGENEGPLVVIKSIIKQRILLETYTNDKELGVVTREIQILNYLRKHPHPNITKITGIFSDRDNIHMEMALHGSGMDLFDYIEFNRRLSEADIRFIFKQACEAVAHLHSHKIVHRDIKDENIVIDSRARIQLIDFGSAAWISDTPFKVFCGTLDYASPEVLAGAPYTGPPQDIWALGILLYTLIYKESPFCNVDEIMAARPKFTFKLSRDSFNLTVGMLEPEPLKRPTIEEVLADKWFKS